MNLREIQNIFKSSLNKLYDTDESSAITRVVLTEVLNYSSVDLILKKKEEISYDLELQLFNIHDRLMQSEPLQYIMGTAWFCNLKLKVNKHVLIPRPETEELVEWIVQENKLSTPQILDIGTGSGCIAIAIANQVPDAKVAAMDISVGALETARKNAVLNNVNVEFINDDILNPKTSNVVYDIIVSNPPYVMQSEKETMDKHVLEFEPHNALFVLDNDALIFYKSIVKFTAQYLKTGGHLYFEINATKAREVVNLLEAGNYGEIIVKRDMQGKERMVRATKS